MKMNFMGKEPMCKNNVFVGENATLIGDVILEENSSVWFNTVIRADRGYVKIGRGSNIQDNSTVHVDYEHPVDVGENVTVGHNVILHGCKIGNNTLIGMGAIILDGAEVGENTIVGAGSLITSGKKIPNGVLCLGSPAKVIRELSDEEISSIKTSAEHYIENAKMYNEQSR